MTFGHAVVLAAGRGRRMQPLTDEVPKAMAPLGDTTLIGHILSKLVPAVGRVHVTVGHRKARLAPHVLGLGAASTVDTEGRPNCWWLHHSELGLIDEPVLVTTCDVIAEIDLGRLAIDHRDRGEPACMLVPVEPVDGIDGDYLHRRGDTVVEVTRERPADTYGSGIQVVVPARVRALTDPSSGGFVHVWRQLALLDELRASRIRPSSWLAFDTIEHLTHVDRRS